MYVCMYKEKKLINTHTHTHTHIYIYMYVVGRGFKSRSGQISIATS